MQNYASAPSSRIANLRLDKARCGFLYLVAIIDWASRVVLAWRLSNTNDANFCAAALEEALLRFGKRRTFNTDHGSTSPPRLRRKLAAAGVEISMDGRGRLMDNIFIERLWRSIKYEEVHLKAYADGREARADIGSWMTFYNFRLTIFDALTRQ